MGKNKSIATKRKDKYYTLAHKEGYRARSAYKLAQLNKKFSFLARATCVVDLCAAPGGWLQICQQVMPVTAKIIGVDLYPIKYIPGVKTIVGDITTDRTRKEILRELQNKKCEVVLHDGAPPVGGTWDKDAYVQNCLVLHACRLACNILMAKGTFVTKVFRSVDYTKLMFVFGQLFEKVEATKPPSSRDTSAEIFVVCRGYKNPKNISPALFTPQEVFAEIDIPQEEKDKKIKISDKPIKGQEGYEEWKAIGGETLYAVMSAAEFVRHKNPEAVLERYNKITFDDEASKPFKDSRFTTEDIIFVCDDLRARGKFDKGKVLKWRMHVWKELKQKRNLAQQGEEAEEPADEEGDEVDQENQKSDDDRDIDDIKKELSGIKAQRTKEIKKKQKKTIDKKLKMASRSGFNPDDDPLAVIDTQDADLYRLKEDKNPYEDVEKYERMGDGIDRGGFFDDDAMSAGALSDDEDETEDEEEVANEKDYFTMLEDVYDEEFNKKIAEGRHTSSNEEVEDTAVSSSGDEKEGGEPKLYDSEEGTSSDDDSSDDEDAPPRKRRKKEDGKEDGKVGKSHKKIGFETVPKVLRDPTQRAKILAIGSAMLDKEKRRDIMEAGYNRYSFNDKDLPSWFRDDEKKHCFIQLPITKEQVMQEKQRQMEISARPAKRVMEAIHRKRVRATAVVKKMVQKAQSDGNHALKNVPSVRQVLKSPKFRHQKGGNKKPLDHRMLGEKKREKQRLAKTGKKGGRGTKRGRK